MIAFIISLEAEGETYSIYYIAIQMGVLMYALESPMRPVFIAKLHLPIASHGSNCNKLQTTFNSIGA